MAEQTSEFSPVEGEHAVTVPSGNVNHPDLVGVRGLLISASGENSMTIVQFDGKDGETLISAFDLIPFEEFEASAAPVDAPTGGGDKVGGIGIYYGTETGNTQDAGEKIRDLLSDCSITACADIADCPVTDLLKHDILILGNSTWNIGDIQFNWEEKLEEIAAQDYTGIKVAMFGLGDAAGYPDTFVDGLGILWDCMKDKGAELVGLWPTEGYDFDDSKGLTEDRENFLGLVLDEDNESMLTEERISEWVAQIRNELKLPETAAV